jgi:ribonuclease BN (tRNA processing enzyme)
MRLTILGNAPVPGPDGAGSGYLVETDTTAVLLDCGPGVVGKLAARRSVAALPAIVISHTHLDHIYDLPILFLKRALEGRTTHATNGGTPSPVAELRVYLPPGGVAEVERVLGGFGIARGDDGAIPYLAGVALTEYDPRTALTIGDLTIAFVGPTRHAPGDCYAMRVTDATGAVLVYSGDTSPDPIVARMATDADCFLCEATLIDADSLPGQETRHMTARAAGSYATEGGSRALVLTHLLDFTPEWVARMEAAARETFAGPVSVAQIGQTFAVTPVAAAR